MAEVLRSAALSALGFRHGMSLRSGGVSRGPFSSMNLGRAVGDDPGAVERNHGRFARAVGYAPAEPFEVSQVHGARVLVADGSTPACELRRHGADALIATRRGLAVAVRTADCLPVLIADPVTGVVAAVHSGWRSTVAGVVGRTVDTLVSEHGLRARDLHAALLPHIGPCCFEVGTEVAAELDAVSDAIGVVRIARPRPHVDLAAVVHAQLRASGVLSARIHSVPGCTCCQPARFFSHRREGAPGGRHLAAIVAQ